MFAGYLWATGSFGEEERTVGPETLAHVPDEFRMAALVGDRKGTAQDFRPARQIGLIDAAWAQGEGRGSSQGGSPPVDTTGAALDTLLSYAGTTERGDNRGPAVERFLAHVGLGPGYAYCAAAVSYCLDAPPEPVSPVLTKTRSATAQDFDTGTSVDADVAMKIGIVPQGWIHVYQKGKGPFGHNGFVQHWRGRCGRTVEANTSKGRYGNQRDGQGIWERRRCYNPESYFHLDVFTPVIYPKSLTIRQDHFVETTSRRFRFPGPGPLGFHRSPRFVESPVQRLRNGNLAFRSAEPNFHYRGDYRRGKLVLRGA